MRNETPNILLIVVKATIFARTLLFLKFNWKSFSHNKVICVHVHFNMLLWEQSYCTQEMVRTPQST